MDSTLHALSDLASRPAETPPAAPAAPLGPAPAPEIAGLTRRLVAGDEAAYRIFHDAYFGRLYRYLLVVTGGDEHATREALQGTLTRVVRHMRAFENEAAFWSWLTVLARSALADDRRKRRRYLAFLDRFTRHTETIAPTAVPSAAPGEDPLDELLRQNLALLPPDERALLEAKYVDRRTVRELAAQFDLTEKALESRLVRLRQKLKAALLADLKRHGPVP